jgi:Domain of unknown function (DUF6487)
LVGVPFTAGPKECPHCRKPMEAGYVIGHSIWWSTGRALAGTIAWTPHREGGLLRERDLFDLKEVGRIGLPFARSPRFQAWRCDACQTVEFSYAELAGSH